MIGEQLLFSVIFAHRDNQYGAPRSVAIFLANYGPRLQTLAACSVRDWHLPMNLAAEMRVLKYAAGSRWPSGIERICLRFWFSILIRVVVRGSG